MAKRGKERQLNLLFEIDRITEVFTLFEPELIKWHKFEDTNKTYGHEYYWWKSRYGEWIQENRSVWGFERTHAYDILFPRIWERYEEKFRRGKALGVPKEALEAYEENSQK